MRTAQPNLFNLKTKDPYCFDIMNSSALILIAWLILVISLSVLPVPNIRIKTELPLDTIVHFLLYGITAILSFRAFRLWLWEKGYIVLFSIFFSFFWGLLLEFVQMFLPYRSFSLADIGANAIGAIVFAVLYSLKQTSPPFKV
jgi:VanZ family protein